MSENKDIERSLVDDDPDGYIRTIASTWDGHIDLIKDWLPHHRDNPGKITDNVLIPAAMYGQLEVLRLALDLGDLSKKDESPEYPGWTLMHFAVEGAQRTFPTGVGGDSTSPVREANNDITTSTSRPQNSRSLQDILETQLDIIYELAVAGVDEREVDQRGHSPSYRACKELDSVFFEGALLIDIITTLKVKDSVPREELELPGLSSIPRYSGWREAVHHLVKWAYLRHHYEILRFCQEEKYISLASPKLLIDSHGNSLRQSQKPLLIDAIYEEDYGLLDTVMKLSSTQNNILSTMYEYDLGHAKKKESVISYACTKFMDGVTQVLSNLLSMDTQHKFLTHVTLSGVGLRRLPLALLHENLTVLDVRDNNLDCFPSLPLQSHSSLSTYRLGWSCQGLQTLVVSNNLFTSIHPDIFHFPCLVRLVMSSNKIQELPMDMWTAPLLKKLEVADNLIAELPCPITIPRIDSLPSFSLTQGSIKRKLGGDHLQSQRRGYVSYNARSSDDNKSQAGFALHFLDLSGNRLSDIPRGLACLAPLLHTLKLARNSITNLGCFSDYPSLLQVLDVSENGITRGIQPSLSEEEIRCIQSQLVESQSYCVHYQHENLDCLKFLYLCRNNLEDLQIEFEAEVVDAPSQSSSEGDGSVLIKEPPLFFPKLQTLKLSDNSLVRFPENIHRLTGLRELAVSGNERITELPARLHNLTSLFTFKYEGISAPIVSELAHLKTTSEILYYLKARELRSCFNTSMRLFLIGHFFKGKTTLLKYLTGSSSPNSFDTRARRIGSESSSLGPNERESTVGIECGKWVCTPQRSSSSGSAVPINFYTWDFAGQEEYYVTHQCFLTNRAVYLLVWNVLDGDAGIQGLSIWLQNLQAKAHGVAHTVIVVGTHVDQIPRNERERKFRIWRDKIEKYRIGRNQSRGFPKIVQTLFVGCPPRSRGATNIDVLNDVIYNTAVNMESPNDIDKWSSIKGFKVKILQEKIPQSYDNLRRFIEDLVARKPPGAYSAAIKKKDFIEMVSDIISGETEVETAVDYLHATTGVILHFNIPVVKNYYIIDPQRWFDLCALVISPDNVSSLVRTGRPGDEKFGLLSSMKMTDEFLQQGCSEHISKLIRSFLSQLSIIHQVNRDYCLVPSAINSDPALSHEETLGCFPRYECYQFENLYVDSIDRLPSVDPLVCNTSAERILEVKETGLIFRRMILLPPIASGFWSKLIALCLQKQDFQAIILQAIPEEYSLHSNGPAHRLRSMIGSLELSWMYWKTGIILYVSEKAVLEVHSLRSHEFGDLNGEGEGEKSTAIYKSRLNKIKNFCYQGNNGWSFIPPHFKEVIEIIVPEIYIMSGKGPTPAPNRIPPTSSKILVKALEIVDEILKNHCEHLASTGIYSLNDLIHVVPCPIDYGDRDLRPRNHSLFQHGNIGSMLNSGSHFEVERRREEEEREREGEGGGGGLEVEQVRLPEECICVFTIENCIRHTFTSDEIVCPKCGPLELEYLAPDLVFADIADFRLDKEQLSQPVTREDTPVAKGAFGIVYKRTLQTKNEEIIDVAVKLFDQIETVLPQSQIEVTRSYSDMRYELNKLSSLLHPHIIRFIGVFTNPHCFVLEWATLLSLEYQRNEHQKANSSMCYTSILYVLMQVTSALSYLHSPRQVGIVHRDLKCSNILVFRFPDIGHPCFIAGEPGDCRVLVKVTDMGICANPLATKNKAIGGLRLLVPECMIADSYRLTEKVDIYTLGSCLYEMMTLRTLPPDDMGEPQYKQLLLSGKRPQFYAKDTPYPTLLFQLLEDCWHQEHYLRPSAEHLYFAIRDLTSLSIFHQNETQKPADHERQGLMLDSFALHPENWITASHCCDVGGGVMNICVALSSQDGRTNITYVQYDDKNERSELRVESIETIKNTEVVSLQITPEHEIFVGCRDGTIFFYNSDGRKTSLPLDFKCHQNHGGIVKVYYCCTSKLIIVAFDRGRVHIRKCTQGLTSHSTWRESCSPLLDEQYEILDVECMLISNNLSCPVFEVWFGLDSEVMEIWRIPIQPDQIWDTTTVSQTRSISRIQLMSEQMPEGVEMRVNRVKKSLDESLVVAVMQMSRRAVGKIAVISVESKICLKLFDIDCSVSSLLLTPSLLAVGSYDGIIHIYDTPNLIDTNTSQILKPRTLHGHYNRIYGLHLLRGCIRAEGYSSLFPTFVGKSTKEMKKDFLVSIGFGRGYPLLKNYKVFKKSNLTRGSYVNSWML